MLGLAVAMALAACQASTPTGPPPTQLPDITAPPLATPDSSSQTPEPSFCVGSITRANATEAYLEFRGPRGLRQGTLLVESITRLLDGAVLLEDATDSGAYDADYVIGGAQLTLALTFAFGQASGVDITAISALYRPPGNASWGPMPLAATSDGGSITIPDGSGAGQLRLDVTWTDGCFVYKGSVRFVFEVISSTVVAACPGDVDGLTAILRAHDDDQVVIKGVARPIGTLSFSARYFPFDAADQVGPFGSWDPAANVIDAASDELLAVSDDDDDLLLSGGFARFYRLTDPSSTSPENAIPVSDAALEVDSTGRLQIESPAEVGRYILELSTSWGLDCLTGGGLAYFTVDINRVVGGLSRPSV